MTYEFHSDKTLLTFQITSYFSLLAMSAKLMIYNVMKSYIKLHWDWPYHPHNQNFTGSNNDADRDRLTPKGTAPPPLICIEPVEVVSCKPLCFLMWRRVLYAEACYLGQSQWWFYFVVFKNATSSKYKWNNGWNILMGEWPNPYCKWASCDGPRAYL